MSYKAFSREACIELCPSTYNSSISMSYEVSSETFSFVVMEDRSAKKEDMCYGGKWRDPRSWSGSNSSLSFSYLRKTWALHKEVESLFEEGDAIYE